MAKLEIGDSVNSIHVEKDSDKISFVINEEPHSAGITLDLLQVNLLINFLKDLKKKILTDD